MCKPVLIAVLILTATCFSNAQELNEQPMYGGKPKPPELVKADEEFVEFMVKQFSSREAASDDAMRRGFAYLARNDWRMAMKRFNQAWLLTPDRAEVFGGFGAALAYQGKFTESEKYFLKATGLAPDNGRLLNDFGFMYQFWATKGTKNKTEREKYLDKSLELFERASRLESSYDRIYFNWAVSLFFKQDYKGAWDKIKEAERLGGKSIEQKFIEDLTKKMARP
ncbi:MAG: hypothetical protein ICV60_00770 [Pyrinomonadaceae bacterium]|nr:hypothetical protein [Pyrinomonadaceae bacterium]